MSRNYSRPAAALQRQLFQVHGMTCRSCELLIERTLQRASGVREVRASERRGEVEIFSEAGQVPTIDSLNALLQSTQYRLLEDGHASAVTSNISTASGFSAWVELGGVVILLIAFGSILKYFNVLALSTPTQGILSLGAVFVVGLTAAASTCLALVGGLLLSVSAKWVESHPYATRTEKFTPLFLFNIGRLLGYFVFGGLVGILGASLSLSPVITGYLTIAIAIVMIMLGFNILKILPKQYCTLPLPRALTRRIQALSDSRHPMTPLTLGALTFFLPCGFTQSMQLLALGSGSFLAGATIMLVFALGTLPSLIGISIVSSIAEGRFMRVFLKFSGALIVILGLLNIESGLRLTGVDPQDWVTQLFTPTASVAQQGSDPNVTINEKGQQIISVRVTEQGYSPASFTIEAGRETWVYATAPTAIFNCASFLTAPSHNLTTQIKQGGNWLGPIQSPQKDFLLTCSMGMFKANVYVKKS